MKTRSLLSIFPALFASMMAGGNGAQPGNGIERHLHSHGTFHKKGKFKGWMRERRRSTFNKNK